MRWQRRQSDEGSRPGIVGERGFSLIEVMIAIGIMAVVYLAVTQILVRVHLSHATMASTMSLRQEARVLLMRIGDEVRGAGHGIVESVEAISHASASELTIALDLDRGSVDRPCTVEAGDDGVEQVTYRVATGRIERRVQCWVAGAWVQEMPYTPVAVNVTAASFRYFDLSGTEIAAGGGSLSAAQRDSVRSIRIVVALADDARAIEGEATPSYQSSADVLVRNHTDFLTQLVEGD